MNQGKPVYFGATNLTRIGRGAHELLLELATSQYFPSTVHGAFLSGVRAAYEITLADTKEDLMENSSRPIDLYV